MSLESGADIRERIAVVGEWIREQNEHRTDNRRVTTAGDYIAQLTQFISRTPSFYYCCMKLIREEFPEVINKTDDSIEEIEAEADPNKGLYEETHFVIFIRSGTNAPVMAVESVMKGAKTRDILQFLNVAMNKAGFKDTIRIEPVFAFDYETFEERIDDVAQLKVMLHHRDIPGFSDYMPEAGELLRQAQRFADSEYVTLEFKINFQRVQTRHPPGNLKERVLEFVRTFTQTPEAKEYVKKLDVRAQDVQANNRLRLFDLIEEKVASEVTVEKKRTTSQYYLSNEMYNAIRERIIQDFREETSVTEG